MVGTGGKRPKIAAVDNHYQPQSYQAPRPDNDHDRLTAQEERQWRSHVRRERSSAYWFAATKWGILGLVVGAILGGVGMYYASISTIDMAQEAVTKGAIVERLRQEREALEQQQQAAPPPATP